MNVTNGLSVSALLSGALGLSEIRNKEIPEKWISLSFRLGCILPNSLLPNSVQQAGKIDRLLRSLEDEFDANSENGNQIELSFDYICMLSDLWIGHIYEIFRILKDQDKNNKEFQEIYHQLQMVRVPLEKHQIANDRKLKDKLLLERHPKKSDDKVFEYSKDNPDRSYIMPRGVSDRGSHMWHVIDVKNEKSYWIERRSISDRILSLLPEDGSAA